MKRKKKNRSKSRNVSKKRSYSAGFDLGGELKNAALLHRSGHLSQAEAAYKEILHRIPNHADTLNLLGLASFQNGKYDAAVEYIREAIRINPSNPLYYMNLGNTLNSLKKVDDAVDAYLHVLAIHPDHAETLNNLGNVYSVQGKMDEALSCYERVVNLNPENPDGFNNLGSTLRKSGRLGEATTVLRKALKLSPHHAPALNNLAMVLKEQNRFVEAIGYYRKALEIQPEADTYNNLVLTLIADGRLDEAASVCRKALEVFPGNFRTYLIFGNLLKTQGKLKDAVSCYENALSIDSEHAETYNNLGDALTRQGKTDKAIVCFQKALRSKPGDFKTYNSLGNALRRQGKLSIAIEAYKKALEIEPGYATACNNMAGTLLRQGKVAEAVKSYQEAIMIKPDYAIAHSNLLLTYNYSDYQDPEWLFSQHLTWANSPVLSKGSGSVFDLNSDSAERKISIGYCSPDFRAHSVAFFLEGIIKAHNRSEFEIFCYSDVTCPDEITRMFTCSVDCFRNIKGVESTAVATQIRRDKIDVLVDLAGHTAGDRISLFSMKPAPIQVTYLGYPNTTGLETMDYRLTDAWADPPGLTDHLYTEKLVRLPHTFLCYTPSAKSPEVEGIPKTSSERITFGSFNNRAKMTSDVIKSWAKILTLVPHSRIVLKSGAFADPETEKNMINLFVINGVERARIELVGYIPSKFDHLQFYNRIDIGLDTFPYNGTTTTCEALWMGVPVITLVGTSHRSRVGASLLHNVGLEDFIAESVEDYVEKGVSLARNVRRRESIHWDLRSRMARSFLMDNKRFTRSLEKTYRWMFREWLGSSGILSK